MKVAYRRKYIVSSFALVNSAKFVTVTVGLQEPSYK